MDSRAVNAGPGKWTDGALEPPPAAPSAHTSRLRQSRRAPEMAAKTSLVKASRVGTSLVKTALKRATRGIPCICWLLPERSGFRRKTIVFLKTNGIVKE